ncbi:MAG: metallophosphoesterase, partial [Rhabdochlamydiaceae bacterium]
MKLTLASDLHIEMHKEIPSFTGGGILLLAGDIMMAHALTSLDIPRYKYDKFFRKISQQFNKIYMIAGNHEAYYGHIETFHDILKEYYQQYNNIHYLNNETVPLDSDKTSGVLLWGGTLWTDYNNDSFEAMSWASQNMSDHYLIKNGKNIFSPQDALKLHNEAKNELESSLACHKDNKFIVMTHHVPFYSALNIAKWGENNLLNYAFGCT